MGEAVVVGGLLEALSNAVGSLVVVQAGVHLVREGSAFFGLSLGLAGVCFLALWGMNVVESSPRPGGVLLLISAIGGISALLWSPYQAPAVMAMFAMAMTPVLLLAATIALVAPPAD